MSFINEIKRIINRFVVFVKSIDSSNYKSKLFNARMAVRYVFIFLFVFIIIIAFNAGKKNSVSEEPQNNNTEYQAIIEEYYTAQKKLPKLRAEIASNSDLVTEIRNFQTNKSEKESEIESLNDEIAELEIEKSNIADDISDLKDEVKKLKSEKKKLTEEIAKAKGKGYKLSAGKYTGGEDIPVGTYNITWISGSGNVIVGTYGSEVNEIFGNNSRFGYIKSYKNCEISYGTEIQIKGNLKVTFKAKD